MLGTFLHDLPSHDEIVGLAQRLGRDDAHLLQLYEDMPVLSKEKADELTDLLRLISPAVSECADLAWRNLQLGKQLEQRAQQISSVARIASLALHADDAHGTFKELAGRINKAAGVNFSCIGRLDPETGGIHILAIHGVPLPKGGRAEKAPISLFECSVLQEVIRDNSITVVDDPSTNPLAHPVTRSFCKAHRLRKLIVAPITSGETTWLLVLGSRRARAVTQQDLSLISALCSQIAIAARNATTYAEQIEARKRATFLAEASQLFNSTLDPDEVLQRVTEKMTDMVGDCCAIALMRDGSDAFEFKALHHRDKRKRAYIAKMIRSYPLHIGEGLIGKAVLAGQPILIRRATEEDYAYFNSPFAEALQIQSAIAAPIKIKGDTTGAIVVTESTPGRELTPNDLELAVTLAEFASVAIENAQLYSVAERERQKLAAVISGMADGVIICDSTGRVTSLNKAATEILVPLEEGAHLAELYAVLRATDPLGEPLTQDQFPLPRVLATGRPVSSFEWLLHRPDGDKRTIHSSAAPIYDGDRQLAGAVAVVRDVTATRQMDKLKGEFISVVSHELRAPLATISGYTQMLIKQLSRKGNFDEELGELELIRVCTHQLATLVRDLLDVSRFETGSLSLNLGPVSLRDLILATATQFDRLSSNHNVRVDLACELPLVLADARRVDQILSNLVSNAIKFSPDGGEVVISARPREHDVTVSVRDHGIGISKYDLARLFDRFFRADNSENRPFEGIGLGLHVCKILVEAQGGQVRAESVKGSGSVFSFTLPLYGGGSADGSGS